MIYTDLANEAYKLYNVDIKGIKHDESIVNGVKVETVEILNDDAAEKLGKATGKYITLTDNYGIERDRARHRNLGEALSKCIKRLLPHSNRLTLVVGLGNRSMTPDALGPYTMDNVMVTRHMLQLFPEMLDKRIKSVCCFAPSVMGVTGIESADIIKAICREIRPSCIIAVDSLAAADEARIGDTIQLCDTGIAPGAGVGNRRAGINVDSVGVPVIAIGVPVVVRMKRQQNDNEMLVTPKNIDAIISDSSQIIAHGINRALHDNITDEEIADFMY